jgi:hypothetical protein
LGEKDRHVKHIITMKVPTNVQSWGILRRASKNQGEGPEADEEKATIFFSCGEMNRPQAP